MSFKQALKTNKFVLTAHVNLANAPTAQALIEQGEILRPLVDALQVTDNPVAEVQMSALAAAALLLQQGIDPLMHMTCRDRNRIALQSDVIGAAALGVSSVLLMHGDKIPDNLKPKVSGVFDMGARELMQFIKELKNADNVALVSDFLVGATATVFKPEADWSPTKLIAKSAAGANFVMTQICFDMDILRDYMARMIQAKLTHKLAFIVSLSPLPSVEAACWMRDNLQGALVPDAVIERMRKADNAEQEGIAICAEMLQELETIPGVRGANLLTLGSIESIPAAITQAGLGRR